MASAAVVPRMRKVRVMISSRCNDAFAGEKLSVHRHALKAAIEAAKLFGVDTFEVWINEDAPAGPASLNSWELCVGEAREAEIVIVLYNGCSGWRMAKDPQTGIGICHAEFNAAVASGSAKVRVIELDAVKPTAPADLLFAADLDLYELFVARGVKDAAELESAVIAALLDALRDLIAGGARDAARGRASEGPALEWTRLDLRARRAAMRGALVQALGGIPAAGDEPQAVITKIATGDVLAVCDAIPGPFSMPSARELVGQPFLRDHTYASQLRSGLAGPVHFIACHRGVTEAQATRQLGFPDALIVKPAFGVYVADNVQKIQMLFLADCRDGANTIARVQEAGAWLQRHREAAALLARARDRAQIVLLLASMQTGSAPVRALTLPAPAARSASATSVTTPRARGTRSGRRK